MKGGSMHDLRENNETNNREKDKGKQIHRRWEDAWTEGKSPKRKEISKTMK